MRAVLDYASSESARSRCFSRALLDYSSRRPLRPAMPRCSKSDDAQSSPSTAAAGGGIRRGRAKLDPRPDRDFYAFPRLVTHVDDGFITTLTDLYRERLRRPWRVGRAAEVLSFFAACTAFDVVLIYSTEMFPTSVRNSAVGLVRQTMVLGGAAAPVLIALGRETSFWSFGVFGIAISCSGLFVPCLPETRGKRMSDTMEEERDEATVASCTGAAPGVALIATATSCNLEAAVGWRVVAVLAAGRRDEAVWRGGGSDPFYAPKEKTVGPNYDIGK